MVHRSEFRTSIAALFLIAGCSTGPIDLAPEPSELDEGAAPVGPAAMELGCSPASCVTTGTNSLKNEYFDEEGKIGPFTYLSGVRYATSVGWSAARSFTTYMNELGDIGTEHLSSGISGSRGSVLRVVTTAPHGGVVQVFLPVDTGPDRVVARARVYVLSGQVGLLLGNGGNGSYVALSTGVGGWEWLEGTNGISPANQVAIYASSAGGAKFYLDEVSVEACASATWL